MTRAFVEVPTPVGHLSCVIGYEAVTVLSITSAAPSGSDLRSPGVGCYGMNPLTPHAPSTLLRFVNDAMIGALLNTVGNDLPLVALMVREKRTNSVELARSISTFDALLAILQLRATYARPASEFPPGELAEPFRPRPSARDLETQADRLRTVLSELSFFLPVGRVSIDHFTVVLRAANDFKTFLNLHLAGRRSIPTQEAAPGDLPALPPATESSLIRGR